MNIVFLEAQSLGGDMDLTPFNELGNVTVYEVDTPEKMQKGCGTPTLL